MTGDGFRVWPLPNLSLESEPDTEIWRDIEFQETHDGSVESQLIVIDECSIASSQNSNMESN